MTTVQYFSDEYLRHSGQATPEQILEYLESFRLMNSTRMPSKLISMKLPQPLLDNFKQRCRLEGMRYQTQIKVLMKDWLKGE